MRTVRRVPADKQVEMTYTDDRGRVYTVRPVTVVRFRDDTDGLVVEDVATRNRHVVVDPARLTRPVTAGAAEPAPDDTAPVTAGAATTDADPVTADPAAGGAPTVTFGAAV